MINTSIIFDFLKYCLGAKGDMSKVVAGMDWRLLYEFASKQAMLGVCFDGIERLGKEYPEVLRHLGLWKFAGAVMYIMKEIFGMKESKLIVPPNEKYGKFVLNDVLEAGNFGRYDKRNRFGHSKLGHNIQRIYRDIRLMSYFPAEALSEPIFRVWHYFWRKMY